MSSQKHFQFSSVQFLSPSARLFSRSPSTLTYCNVWARKGQEICLLHRFSPPFWSFWRTVSGDAEAGPQPPLHHRRRLNPFAPVAFYTLYSSAAFQYRSVTAPFLFIHHFPVLFFSLLLILFSFAVTCCHFLLSHNVSSSPPVTDQSASPTHLVRLNPCCYT